MAFTKNFRTPAQLTAAARAAFRAHVEKYVTAGLLPSQANYTLDFKFGVGQSALPAAASFRSYATESEVGTLEGGETRQGKLPPISIRTPVDEFQQLFMYNQQDGIGQAFEKRAIRNATAVGSRVVLAQAEAIQDGKVTIAERNLSFSVDFGRKSALTATAGTAWSTVATATPIADMEALRAVLGKSIVRNIISQQTATYLQTNADLIKTALGRGTDLPSRISWADVQTVFRDWQLGELEINTEKVVNRAGTEVPVFANDKVVVLTGSQVGTTELGVTAESLRADNGIAQSEAAGLFSGASEQDDPSGYNVLVSAIALPIATATNDTASLDVF
jgi:hypothetical protein